MIDGQVSCHTHDLQTRFPDDVGLVDLGAQSYLGVPLVGTSGEILGHLAVLDIEPMEDDEARALLLRTFASRAAIELERLRATNQIAALNEKLMQAAERARSLLAINNAVVLNLTRDALFQAITDALRPVVPFDRSTIFLYDEDRTCCVSSSPKAPSRPTTSCRAWSSPSTAATPAGRFAISACSFVPTWRRSDSTRARTCCCAKGSARWWSCRSSCAARASAR